MSTEAREGALGYVASTYPSLSQTFVSREIRAIRALGTPVTVFSVRTAGPEHLLSELDEEESRATTYLLPCGVGRLLRTHLGILARHPKAYLATLRAALAAAPPGLRARLWQLFYFAEAGLLWPAAKRAGVRRFHAHLANVAADVAWLAADLGQRIDPGGGWRWSFTMHGPTEFFAVEQFNLRRKVHAASAVICISDYCRSQLMMLSDPEHWDKLRVVHCGVDSTRFAPAERPTADGDPVTILCVGRLVPEKGQALLLEAARRLVDSGAPVRLVLAGDGEDRRALEQERVRAGLTDTVTFLGPVGQDRLAALFADADIFCLPSFAEGVPIVLMEAMASGLPVVTTPVAGIPELVEHGVSGLLVPPGRVDELAAALGVLVGDAKRRREMGAQGRTKVQKSYELDDNAGAVRDILMEAEQPERRYSGVGTA